MDFSIMILDVELVSIIGLHLTYLADLIIGIFISGQIELFNLDSRGKVLL